MATSQAPLEKPEIKGKPLRIAFHATNHLFALALIWVEVWVIVAVALAWHPIALAAFAVLLKTSSYRHELAENVKATVRHAIAFNWQTHSYETWHHPKLVAVEVGTFTGWRTWAHASALNRRPTIPYDRLTLHIRRPSSQGNPKWLETFADWCKRQYRYDDVDTAQHPDDPNRDIVTLVGRAIPNRVEAHD